MKATGFPLLVTIFALLVCLSSCQSTSNNLGSNTTMPVTVTPTVTVPPTTVPQVTLPEFVEVSREGEVSQIPVVTVFGTVGDYCITMDPEYFTFSAHETVDMFAYDTWPGESPVFFCISAYEKGDAQQFVADMESQFRHQYQSFDVEDTTIGAYDATAVYLQSFKDDPAYNKHIFLIHCGEDMYILETQFVTEMYEGLYAIMRALFDTFTAY